MSKKSNSTSDSFKSASKLTIGSKHYRYHRLGAVADALNIDLPALPYSMRVVLEALLRHENGYDVTSSQIEAVARYNPKHIAHTEIPFKPARVVLQDFTGVPCVVDLAAMRNAVAKMGGKPDQINPQVPVDLVIDHSIQVDSYGTKTSFEENTKLEFSRNRERYTFLRWGQQAFRNFRVIPPASGIVHQVNLEYLATVVQQQAGADEPIVYFDSLVGTDSHTTMINGLGVLGWGVGGIEAEAVMLGQPLYMLAPQVIGVHVTGKLPEGVTATDLTLTVTQMLRKKGVVDKFVEFYGPGLDQLSLADRATIANMAPEYGATMGFFPVDAETLRYLRATGRPEELVQLVEAYYRAQGSFRESNSPVPQFTDVVELDLSQMVACIAGPKRPQDRVTLTDVKTNWQRDLQAPVKDRGFGLSAAECAKQSEIVYADGSNVSLHHGDVVIAAITSCTNTSNPSVLLAAGLVAKKAVALGLTIKPYVKTSLAPGSKVVTEYLKNSGLLPYLEQLGFNVVGYGCTTCIGNSGPLPDPVIKAIDANGLVVSAVLSGNRNFEGRISPQVKANYLASPPLVVAYALAGTVNRDFQTEPLGTGQNGQAVYLKDIWPSSKEVAQLVESAFLPKVFNEQYQGIEHANPLWNEIPVSGSELYNWDENSTYIQQPPFFIDMQTTVKPIAPIEHARVLAKLGDSVTTDHISPAGSIPKDSPAGKYLIEHGVQPVDFNSFGARRGNDRVMTRGTFGNIRLKNFMAPNKEGNWTTHLPSGDVVSIYDAAQRYKQQNISSVILAGRDYGMGSSRDWAAKGTYLLGVKAVIAKSYERIHRSNLVGMGVLPLEFKDGEGADELALTGHELFSIPLNDTVQPRQLLTIDVTDADGKKRQFNALCRLDSTIEIDYYRNGGILHTVLRQLVK